jgi:hypothetical protein
MEFQEGKTYRLPTGELVMIQRREMGLPDRQRVESLDGRTRWQGI